MSMSVLDKYFGVIPPEQMGTANFVWKGLSESQKSTLDPEIFRRAVDGLHKEKNPATVRDPALVKGSHFGMGGPLKAPNMDYDAHPYQDLGKKESAKEDIMGLGFFDQKEAHTG